MMLRLTLIFSLCFYCLFSNAQESYKPHLVFAELGGNAGLYSLNYDYKFADKWSVRIGGTWQRMTITENVTGNQSAVERGSVIAFPLLLNHLAGRGNHRVEIGFGALGLYANSEIDGYFDVKGFAVQMTATLGYRYQPAQGGFNFRAGLTPFIPFSRSTSLWVGISFGYGF
jgi:hypothetical protein